MVNKIKPSRSDVHSLNPQSSILNPFQELKKIEPLFDHSIEHRTKIILASNNDHKIKELSALLSDSIFTFVSQAQFNVPPIEETGLTFIENALLKARHACQFTNLPAIADDSGLVVDALNGRPGIHSARYANAKLGSKEYCHRLLQDLSQVPPEKRTARYISVLVFLRHAEDPSPLIGQGLWEGLIIDEMRGSHGFGYDPVFYLPENKCTVAELSPEEKNNLSHRYKAMVNLMTEFQKCDRTRNQSHLI